MLYTDKKILTANDLKIQRGIEGNSFKKRLQYQIKKGYLSKIKKWIYVLCGQKENITLKDILGLACNIYAPSYISFETVLQKEGIIFQDYETIFVACRYNKEITLDALNTTIHFCKIPEKVLMNPIGLINEWNILRAGPERAICDTVYRSPNYYFDNLNDVNKDNIKEQINVYQKPSLTTRVLSLIQD